jgi:hypothetical protein
MKSQHAVTGPAERTPLTHRIFLFEGCVCVCGGGGYIKFMFIFKTCIMGNLFKFSKPTSSYISGKIKTEREKINLHISVHYIFQYSNVLVICRFKWLILAEV